MEEIAKTGPGLFKINRMKIFLCIGSLLLLFTASAQSKRPLKILLLGVFHFENPGLDVAKFKNADVLSEHRQQEVMQIVKRLKDFSPDKIFIEDTPENQYKTDSLLGQYKKGSYIPGVNEIDQLGLRLGKELNLRTLYAVDYRKSDFPFDSLMRSAAETGQIDLINWIKSIIDSVQTSFNTALERSTISQMLIRENTAETIKLHHDFYYGLLPAGMPGNHVGSYLVSEWWRRNMIIYENILKRLDGNENRILVIFGSGHTALLHQMMRYNPNIELVDVKTILN